MTVIILEGHVNEGSLTDAKAEKPPWADVLVRRQPTTQRPQCFCFSAMLHKESRNSERRSTLPPPHVCPLPVLFNELEEQRLDGPVCSTPPEDFTELDQKAMLLPNMIKG